MTVFVSGSRWPGWRSIAISPLLLCFGQLALADATKVYEWHEPNGVVSYSKDPPPPGTRGAATVREIDTRSFTSAQIAAIKAHLARMDEAEQADSKRFREAIDHADRGVTVALRQLAQAERAMRVGRQPRAGERLGNAGGGSRLLATYFERQRQLGDALQQARAAVEQAYRARDEIKP